MSNNTVPMIGPDGAETAFRPAELSSYRRIDEVPLRFNDMDSLGHVTSIAFLNCFETARVQLYAEAGRPVDDPEFAWMLVKLDTDYMGQLHFPGAVRIGTRFTRIGKTSVTALQGMFDGDRCCATLRSVKVHVRRGADRPAEIPADLRTRLWQVDGTLD